MKFPANIVFYLFFQLFLIPSASFAVELTFEENCESVREIVLKRVLELSKKEKLSIEERLELPIIYETVCSESFKNCDFSSCLEEVTPDTNYLILLLKFKRSPFYPIWLDENVSCEEFLLKFQESYKGLSSVLELNVEKRIELESVLEISCSDKFLQCEFSHCLDPDEVKKVEIEAKNKEAKLQIQQLVQSLKEEQEKLIEESKKKEEVVGATWQKISVPGELAEIKKKIDRNLGTNKLFSRPKESKPKEKIIQKFNAYALPQYKIPPHIKEKMRQLNKSPVEPDMPVDRLE